MTNYGMTLKNMISFSDFNKGQAGKIFESVKKDGSKIVVKNNKPECVLVSVDDYLKMIEENNEVRLLLTAADRMDAFDGNMKDTFSQEEIEKILGIDTSDFDEVEIE